MTAPHFTCSILTTAYLPPVSYFFAIAHSDRVLIEQHEVKGPLLTLLDGVGTVADRHHLVAFLLEEQQVCPQLFYLVVHPK